MDLHRWTQSQVIDAFQGNRRCIAFHRVDLEDLLVYRDAHPQADGVPVSLTSLYVVAAARAITEFPLVATHRTGRQEMQPDPLDISLSIGGLDVRNPMAPTILIPDVLRTGLGSVSSQVKTLSDTARQQEASEVAKLSALLPWIPFRWLRRLLIGLVANQPKFLRQQLGHFQISNLQRTGIDFGVSSVVPHTLLMVGEVRTEALVHQGEVKPRRCAIASLHFDHAEVVGAYAGQWLESFHRQLLDPATLYAHAQNLTPLPTRKDLP